MMTGRDRRRGFLLIEACFALTVLVIVLAAAVKVFQQGAAVVGRQRQIATALAVLQAMQEKYADWQVLADEFGADSQGRPRSGTFLLEPETINFRQYRPSLDVNTVVGNQHLCKITAVVEWDDARMTVISLKADY